MNNSEMKAKPIIVHLIYRFDIGGLERVMVNCINAMKGENYQHVVIALTEVSTFAQHLNSSVQIYQLYKKSGKDLASHWRLYKLLRQIKPQIIHSYNLAALEYQVIAKLAGVKGHIHAEHGRDSADPQGLNKKHNLLRKLVAPFVHFFVAVSTDLAQWLQDTVEIKSNKIELIRNGINTDEFYHQTRDDNEVRFIHVARLDLVKDQANLITAFAKLQQTISNNNTRLTIVGDGAQMSTLKHQAAELNISEIVEFTGARSDIADLLANADVFVLSSIAEGIPMTVLEAMASSLPIISTNVGGLAELITDRVNGALVEKQNSHELSQAMAYYIDEPQLIKAHGERARCFIENNFSEKSMVDAYIRLYNKSLGLN